MAIVYTSRSSIVLFQFNFSFEMAFNGHQYGVFCFLDDNGVEFVDFAPTVWADEESGILQWPPGKMAKNGRKHTEKSLPKSNWLEYGIVKVLYTTSKLIFPIEFILKFHHISYLLQIILT